MPPHTLTFLKPVPFAPHYHKILLLVSYDVLQKELRPTFAGAVLNLAFLAQSFVVQIATTVDGPIAMALLRAILVILLSLLSSLGCLAWDGNDHLRKACNVTLYPDLCFSTLASLPSRAKSSPSGLARAAISVTVAQTKNVSQYTSRLRQLGLRGSARMAVEDCVECFGDALDNLYRSLFEIRRLESGTYEFQVSNMQTWVSVALSSEDTCLDGFSDGGYEMLPMMKEFNTPQWRTFHALQALLCLLLIHWHLPLDALSLSLRDLQYTILRAFLKPTHHQL